MPVDRFIDLDELVLECKSASAKRYIAEAVLCYRAGAFRACIVVTWVAVVYDIIEKLRELDLTGDKNAHEKLAHFDRILQQADLRAALEFERGLLELAKGEFELLSDVEHAALVRLQDDRNRCAHPSFFSPGEVYSPPPELARTHLRSAVEYLLRHAPVQGKAALDRVLKEIGSVYFPDDKDEALTVLRAGPVARARAALAKNLVVVLLKDLVKSELDKPAHTRRSAALRATIELHHEIAEAVFAEKVNALISGLEDQHLIKVVATAYRVPEVRPFFATHTRLRLCKYVANVQEDLFVAMFPGIVGVDFLKDSGITRLMSVTRSAVAKIGSQVPACPIPALVARVAKLYEDSGNFEQANAMGIAISNLAPHFDAKTAAEVLRSAANNQVRFSTGFRGVVEAIKKTAVLPSSDFNRALVETQADEDYSDLLYPDDHTTEAKASPDAQVGTTPNPTEAPTAGSSPF